MIGDFDILYIVIDYGIKIDRRSAIDNAIDSGIGSNKINTF